MTPEDIRRGWAGSGPHKRRSIDIGWQVSIYVSTVLLIVLLVHILLKWGQP